LSEAGTIGARVAEFVRDLQARICAAFEAFEPEARFEAVDWSKPTGHPLEGGGQRRIMRGQVFEKVGVNVSHVWGSLSPQFRTQIPGAVESEGRFEAAGVSLVAHMANPFVPAVHMNVRVLSTSRTWFGGGADLTPTFPFPEDTRDFHDALRGACDRYRPGAYDEYKEWCDRYFYLPHRQEPRGVGGIFFDDVRHDVEQDFAFIRDVGDTFLDIYPRIVMRRQNQPFGEREREAQLVKRGRYVEFNLVYDRGTKFGFGTDADPESYLMSLPPLVKW
jgi:coproporphyrinogen III oxidase